MIKLSLPLFVGNDQEYVTGITVGSGNNALIVLVGEGAAGHENLTPAAPALYKVIAPGLRGYGINPVKTRVSGESNIA